MAQNSNDADYVKGKGRSKTDKARRNFELNGQHSSKHVRIKEAEREAKLTRSRAQKL